MGWLTVAEVVVAVVFVCLTVFVTALFIRRRWLSARGGVIDCGLRINRSAKSAWSMGLVRYEGSSLEWYRVFSISPRPRAVFPRTATHIVGHRLLDSMEAISLFEDHVAVAVRLHKPNGQYMDYELSMTPASVTGMMSWLEAAPPGGATYRE